MKLYIQDNVQFPKVRVLTDSDPAPDGYTVSEDIVDWDVLGGREVGSWAEFNDYKKLRSEIAARVNAKAGFDPLDPATYTMENWDLLTEEEKRVSCRNFLVPEVFRSLIYTIDEQISMGMQFHSRAIESRSTRYKRAMAELYARLSIDDAREVERELSQIPVDTVVNTELITDKLVQWVPVLSMAISYMEHGIEGTLEDNGRLGLFDYLLSRAGTPFEGVGFSAKGYTVSGMADCSELADRLYDVFVDGAY